MVTRQVNDDVLAPPPPGADAPWAARAAPAAPLLYEYGGREFDLARLALQPAPPNSEAR